MRTRKIVKHFDFEETNRNRLTLHDQARLDPETNRVILKETLDGFPTDPDIFVKSWIANPGKARQWVGFQADVVNFKVDGVQVTDVKFRLGDGTDERYWDGAAWTVTTTSWNTEAEIANNISSFPTASRKIQIVANLSTSNAEVSPELVRVKVLYLSDIDFQEEYVYRLMVRSLRENVHPISNYAISLAAAGSTVNLNSYPLETPYNLVDIDSVFNHTDDPDHLVDILSSFNPTTKVITLSGSVEEGKTLWIRFVYEPEVAVTTSSEYHEVAKTPAIILEDVNLVRASEIGWDDTVINKDSGAGWKVPSPLRGDLEISLVLLADKGLDLHKMADEVKRFCLNNPLVRSPGLDEEYRLWLMDEFDMANTVKLGDVHTARMGLRLVNVMFALREAVEIFAVKRFNLTGDMNVTVQA